MEEAKIEKTLIDLKRTIINGLEYKIGDTISHRYAEGHWVINDIDNRTYTIVAFQGKQKAVLSWEGVGERPFAPSLPGSSYE